MPRKKTSAQPARPNSAKRPNPAKRSGQAKRPGATKHPDPDPNLPLPQQTLVVGPGPSDRTVCLPSGDVVAVPDAWSLLPPGDAGVTRRVKAAGPTWTMKERKGRREFSKGLWADAAQIHSAKEAMESTRSTPQYAKAKAAAKVRREEKQEEYVEDFHAAVVAFLNFHSDYAAIGKRLASAVTEHATPVGSGTVARTQRIPIERRAESAVIAWMRHQTTAYDNMAIARVKGERREVRRQLAAQSRKLLEKYRSGAANAMQFCPLAKALRS
ncbi:hypothetical protein FHS27_002931 [Rhodopirellula rubra]|uniref:DUF2293 domain-containing protein n=1 Tax=Aporhodopirellula rubra TaxID=980271 RepID=A0A7W5H558_9BACT|nr:DUF2293 domain-containing protein [Aporhodopirellula rubra]MBB3207112.1 hypothetical protein [Aporhodopirellula rubra]